MLIPFFISLYLFFWFTVGIFICTGRSIGGYSIRATIFVLKDLLKEIGYKFSIIPVKYIELDVDVDKEL